MNDDLAKHLTQQVAQFYEQHGSAFARTRGYTWNEEREIARYAHPGMTVVDVGAGNGRLAHALEHVPDIAYIGIEPSSSLRAAADPGRDLRPGALPHLPLPDQIADITVCLAVFHHLPGQAERILAADELIRITKPQGILAVSSWFIDRSDTHLRAVVDGEKGDAWIPWNAEGAHAERYVHAMNTTEWQALWSRPELTIEKIGLFGKETWTQDLSEARNWFVIAKRV